MKIYSRRISKREPINRFGKLGFKWYYQYVMTDNIAPFNARKQIKFEEIDESDYEIIKAHFNMVSDHVYEVEDK